MSEQTARDFVGLVRSDPDLASRLNAAGSAQARLDIAREAGYEFTEEELEAAKAHVPDDELEGVAGGNDACTCWFDFF